MFPPVSSSHPNRPAHQKQACQQRHGVSAWRYEECGTPSGIVANEFVSDTARRPAHGDFLPPRDGYSRPGGYWSQTSALLDPLIAVLSAPWVSPAFQDAPLPPHPRPDRAGPRVVKRREGVWSWMAGVGISFLPISWGGVRAADGGAGEAGITALTRHPFDPKLRSGPLPHHMGKKARLSAAGPCVGGAPSAGRGQTP